MSELKKPFRRLDLRNGEERYAEAYAFAARRKPEPQCYSDEEATR